MCSPRVRQSSVCLFIVLTVWYLYLLNNLFIAFIVIHDVALHRLLLTCVAFQTFDWSVPDEGYSRNVQCALYYISTFLLFYFVRLILSLQQYCSQLNVDQSCFCGFLFFNLWFFCVAFCRLLFVLFLFVILRFCGF